MHCFWGQLAKSAHKNHEYKLEKELKEKSKKCKEENKKINECKIDSKT